MSDKPVIGNISFGPTEHRSLLPDGMTIAETITPVYKFNTMQAYAQICTHCLHWRKHEHADSGTCLSPKLVRALPMNDEVSTTNIMTTGPNFGCVNFQNKE